MKAGKWSWDKDAVDWNVGGWRCSICGGRNANIGGHSGIDPMLYGGSNYCPHCGARVNGKGRPWKTE